MGAPATQTLDASSKPGYSLPVSTEPSLYQDKVVWITGASSGIGEALALELARQGATLVLTARREERLQALRQRCPVPEQVHLLVGDLFDESSRAGLSEQAQQVAGPLDLLINNAGMSQRSPALETRLQDVRRIMELNFFVPVGLTNLVLPGMLERGRGRIAIISSVAGYVGTPLRSTYAASKHAVRGYFDSLRAELHDTGVGVTVVCPGYIRTEISESAVGDGGRRHGKLDRAIERGMEAQACARVLAKGLAEGRSEVHVGGKEVMAIYLKRFLPSLIERFVPNQTPS